LERWFGKKNSELIRFAINGKEVVVDVPKEILLSENLQLRKLMVSRDYINFVDAEAKVVFRETFSKELFSQSLQ